MLSISKYITIFNYLFPRIFNFAALYVVNDPKVTGIASYCFVIVIINVNAYSVAIVVHIC